MADDDESSIRAPERDKTPFPIYAELLRKCVRDTGYDGKEFAEKVVGISYNTFRNAFKRNGRIETETAKEICQALNECDVQVSLDDLNRETGLRAQAVQLYKLFHERQSLLDKLWFLTARIHPNVVFTAHGDPRFLPFAGEYIGWSGLQQYEKEFKRVIEPLDDGFGTSGTVLTDTLNQMVVFITNDARIRIRNTGQILAGPVRVTGRYEKGKFVQIDTICDTGSLYPLSDTAELPNPKKRTKNFFGWLCGRPGDVRSMLPDRIDDSEADLPPGPVPISRGADADWEVRQKGLEDANGDDRPEPDDAAIDDGEEQHEQG